MIEYYHDKEGFIFFTKSARDKSTVYIIAVDIHDGWYCTCEDYKFRKRKCKHIKECEDYLQKNYNQEYDKYKNMDIFVNSSH